MQRLRNSYSYGSVYYTPHTECDWEMYKRPVSPLKYQIVKVWLVSLPVSPLSCSLSQPCLALRLDHCLTPCLAPVSLSVLTPVSPLSCSLSRPCLTPVSLPYLAPCLAPVSLPCLSPCLTPVLLYCCLSRPCFAPCLTPCLTPCLAPCLASCLACCLTPRKRDTGPKFWGKNSQSTTKLTLTSHQLLPLVKGSLPSTPLRNNLPD